MQSPNRPYLPVVDALRGLAALLVVGYHGQQLLRVATPLDAPAPDPAATWTYSANPLVTLLVEGHSGVALFLVLSGFVLTSGSLHRTVDTRTFLRNRALRVLPLFLPVLLLAVLTTGAAFELVGLVQTLLGFGTLPGGYAVGPFGGVLWTVVVEVQLYLLFPLLLRLVQRGGVRPLLGLLAAGAALRTLALLTAADAPVDQVVFFSVAGRVDQFLLGVLAAVLVDRHRDRLADRRLVAAGAVAVLTMLWTFNQVRGYVEPGAWRAVWVDVEGACWAVLVVGLVARGPALRSLPGRAAVWVGERSYSLYLLHFPVLVLVADRGWLLRPTGAAFVDATLTTLVVALPAALALAALTYGTVERPFLQLRRRDTALTPAPAPAVP